MKGKLKKRWKIRMNDQNTRRMHWTNEGGQLVWDRAAQVLFQIVVSFNNWCACSVTRWTCSRRKVRREYREKFIVQFQNIVCHFWAEESAMHRRFAWSGLLCFEIIRQKWRTQEKCKGGSMLCPGSKGVKGAETPARRRFFKILQRIS